AHRELLVGAPATFGPGLLRGRGVAPLDHRLQLPAQQAVVAQWVAAAEPCQLLQRLLVLAHLVQRVRLPVPRLATHHRAAITVDHLTEGFDRAWPVLHADETPGV